MPLSQEEQESAKQAFLKPGEQQELETLITQATEEAVEEQLPKKTWKEQLHTAQNPWNEENPEQNGEASWNPQAPQNENTQAINLPQNLQEALNNAQTPAEVIRIMNEILSGEEYLNERKDHLNLINSTIYFANSLYRLTEIDVANKTIQLDNGRAENTSHTVSFEQFLTGFHKIIDEKIRAKIIEPLNTAQKFLSYIYGKDADLYGDMEFDTTKNLFLDKGRKHEKDYQGMTHFISKNGKNLLKIEKVSDNEATISFYSNFSEQKVNNEYPWDIVHNKITVSYTYLAYLFEFYGLRNNGKIRACNDLDGNVTQIGERDASDLHTEHGSLKHLFGRASFHDLFWALKKSTEFIKKRLEHGNHLQEARIMLALGKKLWMENWNKDWYLDLKSEVENNEKKLIDDRVEELGKMSTPDRQESVKHSLLNDGTHDYEHIASALSMLEKQGTCAFLHIASEGLFL